MRRPTIAVLIAVAACVAAAPTSAPGAAAQTYYTDFDDRAAKVRPSFIDGSRNTRSGPFRSWRGWGTSKAVATSRTGSIRVTATLTSVRTCAGKRQYSRLRLDTFENGRRAGDSGGERFRNPACR